MAITNLLIFFGMISAVAGLILIVRYSLSGRIGFDAHCRRCNFNVSRRPRDSANCPECGAALDAPRAIILGAKSSDRRQAKLGIFLLLAGGSIPAVFWMFRVGNVDVARYKPAWMLLTEARSGNVNDEWMALEEMERRIKAGSVKKEDLASFAAVASGFGADRPKRLNSAWRRIFLSALSANAVSDSELKQYIADHLSAKLVVRSPTRQGDPLAFGIVYQLTGSLIDDSLYVAEVSMRLRIEASEAVVPLTTDATGKSSFLSFSMGMSPQSSDDMESRPSYCVSTPEFLRALAVGKHEIAGELLVETVAADGRRISQILPCPGEVEIVPHDAPHPAPIAADDLWATARKPRAWLQVQANNWIGIPSALGADHLGINLSVRSGAGQCALGAFVHKNLSKNWSVTQTGIEVPPINPEIAAILLGSEPELMITADEGLSLRDFRVNSIVVGEKRLPISVNKNARQRLEAVLRPNTATSQSALEK